MNEFREKYINPFTDYGFKRLFGEEPNKDLLLDFLNEILKSRQVKIADLTYLKNEQLGPGEVDRRAVFDLYCTSEDGEKFIVLLHKTKHMYFKDWYLYYSKLSIREQAITGSSWDFQLKKVYLIAILDFIFEDKDVYESKFQSNVMLTDTETKEVFYDKLQFIYLEMPKFKKEADELETRFDKWMYVLKNLHKLDRMPGSITENIFSKLFEVAEIAKFTPDQIQSYEDSLKYYRDLKNSLDTAKEEGMLLGREKGREEGKIEIIKKMLEKGTDVLLISDLTGIPIEEIEKIKS